MSSMKSPKSHRPVQWRKIQSLKIYRRNGSTRNQNPLPEEKVLPLLKVVPCKTCPFNSAQTLLKFTSSRLSKKAGKSARDSYRIMLRSGRLCALLFKRLLMWLWFKKVRMERHWGYMPRCLAIWRKHLRKEWLTRLTNRQDGRKLMNAYSSF